MATDPRANREISIRPATVSDCEELTALMLRSAAYQGRYRAMIAQYPVAPAMIAKGEVWIVEHGGAIVGFYRLDVAGADLDLMFVDDSMQGTGLGRVIFEHMVGFATERGLHEIRIVAHPPAVDFYRRMGAVDVGIQRALTPEWWDRPVLSLKVPA